jgi:hypothetical protein
MAAKIDKLCGSTTTFSCDDPIFAAIAEHKMLIKRSDRLEKSATLPGTRRKKGMGNGLSTFAVTRDRRRVNGQGKQSSHRFTINGTAPAAPSARLPCEWPG